MMMIVASNSKFLTFEGGWGEIVAEKKKKHSEKGWWW